MTTKEALAMTEPTQDQINETIAMWDGWAHMEPGAVNCNCPKQHWRQPNGAVLSTTIEVVAAKHNTPDYTSSLDALRPVELRLNWKELVLYAEHIQRVTGPKDISICGWLLIPAEIRARALHEVLKEGE